MASVFLCHSSADKPFVRKVARVLLLNGIRVWLKELAEACQMEGNAPISMSCKISEFLKKSPLSGAGKHHNFQVTSCHHFDTTNVNFAYIESE